MDFVHHLKENIKNKMIEIVKVPVIEINLFEKQNDLLLQKQNPK